MELLVPDTCSHLMMKKLIPTVAAVFVAVAPAYANDDVRIKTSSEQDVVGFEVYRGNDKVWNTALECRAIRAMGPQRVENMIRAYAQDAFEETNGRWAAAQFEKQLTQQVTAPVSNAASRCTIR